MDAEALGTSGRQHNEADLRGTSAPLRGGPGGQEHQWLADVHPPTHPPFIARPPWAAVAAAAIATTARIINLAKASACARSTNA